MARNTELTKQTATTAAVKHNRAYAPHTDIFENDKEFLILADLPGVSADGVQIEMKVGELRIEAMQKAPEGLAGFDPIVWTRSFWVPEFVDGANIAAELKAGVMHLHLPKQEAARPRKISVRTA